MVIFNSYVKLPEGRLLESLVGIIGLPVGSHDFAQASFADMPSL